MRESGLNWQQLLKQGFKSPQQLLEYLELTPGSISEQTLLADRQFATRVPKRFVDKMKPGDSLDPLLLQILAQDIEMRQDSAFSLDPLAEVKNNPVPGLLHKYRGRVLVTLSSVCAVNCRYCFRRHFPYRDNLIGTKHWQAIGEYLAFDDSIKEVILSGGDPMMVSNRQWRQLIDLLESLKHIETVRIHTRLPIVLPERFDDEWFDCLAQTRLNKVMVMHCNHANELDEDIAVLCHRLKLAGFHLLNQSVLLKAVNDNLLSLIDLSHGLFKMGVLPYYLHLLDKVQGAAHFWVKKAQAKSLHRQMKAQLPGYLVPKLVEEIAGQANKTWI